MSTKPRNSDVNPFAVEPYPYRYDTMRTDPVGSLYSLRREDRIAYHTMRLNEFLIVPTDFSQSLHNWRKRYGFFAYNRSKNVIGKFGKHVLLTRRNKKYKYFKEYYCNL